MNAHFHTELFTQVATYPYSASGVFIHAPNERHQPLLNAALAKSPPDAPFGYMIECFFQIDKGHVQCPVNGINFSCNWRTMNMASVMLRPCIKANCMSSTCSCCHRKFSATLSRTFMTWSSNLRPR